MATAPEQHICRQNIDMKNKSNKCARAACDNLHQSWQHKDTGFMYCTSCARKINDAAGEKIVVRI